LQDVPRHGFFVRPLSAKEVGDIYPIRGILDPAALRLAGIPSPEAIARLREINRRLAQCTEPAGAVRLDDELHLELVSNCPNPVLIDLIQQFMWRTRRYELGLMRHRGGMPGAVATHKRIIAALAPGEQIVYCSAEPNLAAGMLERIAGEPLQELFDRLVGRPLRMGPYHLFLTPTGTAYGGGGHRFRPRDFLKLAADGERGPLGRTADRQRRVGA